MPDLLLELFSEEIPARMQRKAADDLRRLVADALVEAGFLYEGAKAFATPRRLTLTISGIPARSPDIREERKGPRVDAPEKAIAGFLKGAGLASVGEAKVQSDPKKGDFYVAIIEKPGIAAEAMLAEALPRIIREFPWPKSMRWGEASVEPGALRWVRPLHAIVATFGPETEDSVVIRFAVDGVAAGDTTYGHRFMAPAPIRVRRFDDYQSALEKAHVVLDADRRKDIVLHDARERAFALGLELIEDDALLEEVAGLNEWPVVLAGSFDRAFLDLPPEVVRATIRANQKCFVLRDPAAGDLANRFVMVANIEASDGGKAIVAGNERVIRARLADARHFWDTDRKALPDHGSDAMRAAAERLGLDLSKPLDQRMAKLAATDVVFHEKLGTQGQRVERIVRLAGEIAEALSRQPNFFDGKILTAEDLKREQNAFRKKVERAAALAKADLATEMVREFPELQGLMGRYYAEGQGEDASVAAAIADHYKPQGPGDAVPSDPVAIAVALADKLDMLVGFWAIDEKPTGSKDPYALRRAALGVIRIVLEHELRLGLLQLFDAAVEARKLVAVTNFMMGVGGVRSAGRSNLHDLLAFFADRLKVQLREEGARHDLVDAVFALGQAPSARLTQRAVEVAYGTHPPLEGEGRAEGAGWGEAEGEAVTPTSDAARRDLPPPGGGEDGVTGRAPRRVRLEDGSPHRGGGEETPPPSPPHKGEGRAPAERGADPTSPSGSGAFPTSATKDVGDVGAKRREGVEDDDLLMIVRRVEALGAFLDTDDGANLLTGYRRAINIIRDEERKSGEEYSGDVDARLLTAPEEVALHRAIEAAARGAAKAVAAEDFAAAMSALAGLRVPVDAFFDKVRVNAEDADVRRNRLRLLNRIREAMLTVADFSRVEG